MKASLMETQAASSTAPADEDSGGSAAEFVDRFERAWSSSDPDRLLELLADDVVLIQPMAPRAVGKAEARALFERFFRLIPDLHVSVRRWAAREDLVFIEFTLEGTFAGGAVSWPAVDRFWLRGDVARERVSYFDPLQVALDILKRPRGWRRVLGSGLRPSFAGPMTDGRDG